MATAKHHFSSILESTSKYFDNYLNESPPLIDQGIWSPWLLSSPTVWDHAGRSEGACARFAPRSYPISWKHDNRNIFFFLLQIREFTFHHLKFDLWKKGLAAERMTLWDSSWLPSSQARVTSAKSKSEWSSFKVSVAADSNLFHFREYLSSIFSDISENHQLKIEIIGVLLKHKCSLLFCVGWVKILRNCCSINIGMEMM